MLKCTLWEILTDILLRSMLHSSHSKFFLTLIKILDRHMIVCYIPSFSQINAYIWKCDCEHSPALTVHLAHSLDPKFSDLNIVINLTKNLIQHRHPSITRDMISCLFINKCTFWSFWLGIKSQIHHVQRWRKSKHLSLVFMTHFIITILPFT